MATARTHSLERTSPKGGPFIGYCRLCGQRELRMADALEPCENPIGFSCDESLLMALEPIDGD